MNINHIHRATALLEKSTDALVIFNHEYSGQPMTQYLSGFSGSTSVLAVTQRDAALFLDGRYWEIGKAETRNVKIIEVRRTLTEEFAEWIRNESVSRIFLDSTISRYADILRIQKTVSDVITEPLTKSLAELRTVKDADEINAIRLAVDVAAEAFLRVIGKITCGVTERDIARMIDIALLECGADAPAFETIVASGPNGAKPHARPSDHIIQKGELVTIDFGARKNGYHSDITRTVAVGKIPEKTQSIFNAVREAQEAGRLKICAGVQSKDVDAAASGVIRSRGFGDYIRHGTGHGLGMEVHEFPVISSSNANTLDDGMVVTCEPGIYVEGLGGVRIEDDILVTANGSENLSSRIPYDIAVS